MEWIVGGLAGAILGLAIGYVLWAAALGRARQDHAHALAGQTQGSVALATREAELAAERARGDALAPVRDERDRIAAELAALKAGSAAREIALAEQAAALRAQFDGLAQAALQQSQDHFRKLSDAALTQHRETADAGLKALLTPVADTLARYETGLKTLEATREQAYGSLTQQLGEVAHGQRQVQAEAGRLVTALRSSGKTSGSWGEQQLRNVLEMAGLRESIDFTLQTSIATETGQRRPDAIVRMPGDRQLIIDSKCSLNDYLEACGCDEVDRRPALLRHAANVRVNGGRIPGHWGGEKAGQ